MGGVDKGLVELDGRPMVAHVLSRLAPQVGEVLVNANQNLDRLSAPLGYPSFPTTSAGFAGPLAGLHAGLSRATPRLRRHGALRLAVPACRSRRTPRRCAPARRRATRGGEDLRPAASGVRPGAARRIARISPRSSKAADARSTPGMRRSRWWRCSFDDEADAFRNINTADELSAAAKMSAPGVPSAQLRSPGGRRAAP